MKWRGFCFLSSFPSTCLSATLFSRWPEHERPPLAQPGFTFRLSPRLFLHAVAMMEMARGELAERARDIERWSDGERERARVWSGGGEMSRPVRMHWFHITFLVHFNRQMLPSQENAILISRLRPNICTIQIGGVEGMWYRLGIWLFLLILLSHIDVFWAFHCSAKMKSFRVGAVARLRKHILFCRAWQGLSCYLNNMSSAEVAPKIYLWNFYVVKSGGEL